MDIFEEVSKIKVWKRGDQRAPHKPLLLLLMLGRYQSGSPRMIEYSSIEEPLRQLLKDFGPSRKTYHPELPFWHLYTDGFWDLANVDIPGRIGSVSVKRKMLLENNALGGLKDEYYQQVIASNDMDQLVQSILMDNFPETIHAEILLAVGLDETYTYRKKKRDPKFRKKVMRAYQYKCAVCGFSSWMGEVPVGVEAAHIKWHQAGGPDVHTNGLALCSLHHKLFDRGMMTVSDHYRVLVSEHAHGTGEFDRMVMHYHGRDLKMPVRSDYYPKKDFLYWHLKEVFRSPGYVAIE